MFLLALDSGGATIFKSPQLPADFSPPAEIPAGEQVHAVELADRLVTELRTRPGDRLILGMPVRILRDEAGKSL